MQSMSPIRYLMNNVLPETEAVVELGSGWSSNLFQLFVGLGRPCCNDVDFIGAEYTDDGRSCARIIADLDGVVRYKDYHMDYRNADVSFLKSYKKHVLVFTHHSIEQVDFIDPKLYQQLAALDAQVTLIHFEPVGWQRDARLLAARQAGDDDLFKLLQKQLPNSLVTEQDQINNAAWLSWRGGYNVNLTAVIKKFADSGQITMVETAYDFSGRGNVLNPSTLYHVKFKK